MPCGLAPRIARCAHGRIHRGRPSIAQHRQPEEAADQARAPSAPCAPTPAAHHHGDRTTDARSVRVCTGDRARGSTASGCAAIFAAPSGGHFSGQVRRPHADCEPHSTPSPSWTTPAASTIARPYVGSFWTAWSARAMRKLKRTRRSAQTQASIAEGTSKSDPWMNDPSGAGGRANDTVKLACIGVCMRHRAGVNGESVCK